MNSVEGPGATYVAAGVDIAAGERAVELMKASVTRASRPEVIGGLGGFSGLFELDLSRWRRPLLSTSTDGVGTKLAIAQAMAVHDTIGIDLVGMVVDDLVVCGAEPLFMTDYIACGQVVPERMAAIVGGVAEGCRQAGCALIGGETAEHPGMLRPDEYDLAGAGTGIVEADDVLSADRVREGDVAIAMGSSGLHSNGYALVRHVLLGAGRMHLESPVDDLDEAHSLGEVLLTPTRIYAQDCLALARETAVRVFAHVTGGGLAANLSRVLPAGLDVVVERNTWAPGPVFDLVAQRGRVEQSEMERTFNMGVGMIALVSAEDADRAIALLLGRHVPAWVLGEVVTGTGAARLVGAHTGG